MPAKKKKKATTARPKKKKWSVEQIKSVIRKKPAFLDERLAPEVDHNLLLSLVRREVNEQSARDVYRFVHLFKSWNDAYCAILVREYREAQGSSDEGPKKR